MSYVKISQACPAVWRVSGFCITILQKMCVLCILNVANAFKHCIRHASSKESQHVVNMALLQLKNNVPCYRNVAGSWKRWIWLDVNTDADMDIDSFKYTSLTFVFIAVFTSRVCRKSHIILLNTNVSLSYHASFLISTIYTSFLSLVCLVFKQYHAAMQWVPCNCSIWVIVADCCHVNSRLHAAWFNTSPKGAWQMFGFVSNPSYTH